MPHCRWYKAEPVMFNKQESLKKALGYIEEAAGK